MGRLTRRGREEFELTRPPLPSTGLVSTSVAGRRVPRLPSDGAPPLPTGSVAPPRSRVLRAALAEDVVRVQKRMMVSRPVSRRSAKPSSARSHAS